MATGGTVTVAVVGTALGQQLTGTLSNLTFAHVTIDQSTFMSTPVGDGCTSSITSASFDGTLEAP